MIEHFDLTVVERSACFTLHHRHDLILAKLRGVKQEMVCSRGVGVLVGVHHQALLACCHDHHPRSGTAKDPQGRGMVLFFEGSIRTAATTAASCICTVRHTPDHTTPARSVLVLSARAVFGAKSCLRVRRSCRRVLRRHQPGLARAPESTRHRVAPVHPAGQVRRRPALPNRQAEGEREHGLSQAGCSSSSSRPYHRRQLSGRLTATVRGSHISMSRVTASPKRTKRQAE